MQTLFRKAN